MNDLQTALIRFKDARQAYKDALRLKDEFQADLYQELQKEGYKSVEMEGVGRATVVYKSNYRYNDEVNTKVMELEQQIQALKRQQENIQTDARLKEQYTEDKVYSHIVISNS